MKRYNIISLALLVALLVSSCVEMDTYPEGKTITSQIKSQVVSLDPSKAEAGVNAVFSVFSAYMPVTSSRHNDFGYPAIMLMLDHNGMDMVCGFSGYNWFKNSMSYNDRLIDKNYEPDIAWYQLYKQIYAANAVVSSIVEPEEPLAKYYLAQGLAARAFEYWVLAQMYQFNYADHKTSPCVPIVTVENSNTVALEGAPRATVQEVYDLIMSDINAAVGYLEDASKAGIKPADKRYIGLDVAYGLRARVELTMEKWDDAAADANKAIQASACTPYTIAQAGKPAFWSSTDNNMMWSVLIAETDAVVESAIINWPSHLIQFAYGYQMFDSGKYINKALFNTISDSDVRKGWWSDANGESKNLDEDHAPYCAKPYIQAKFASYKDELQTSTNANDIPLMRIEEMYLIKAEGELKGAAGASAAKSTIENFIQTYRDPQYTFSTGSAQEMADEIWRQRRIELWGEGLSWFDIMRLNKNVDRRGAGYPEAAYVFNIQAGDNVLLWRLPEGEINGNPALTEADNNPATPLPTSVPDIEE